MKKSVQFLLLFLMCISASWTWASDAPERTVLFNMGDYDSQYWRIPALVTAADNSLVAVVDKRGSSLGDLPNTISIMSRRSTDNGKNWSEPVVVAQGGNELPGHRFPSAHTGYCYCMPYAHKRNHWRPGCGTR